MNRRLAHIFVDNYGGASDTVRHRRRRRSREADGLTKGEITRIVNDNELWFVVVANPDGYDFTFTPGNRLWRKNLRDNDGDGEITDRRRRRPQPQLPDEVGLRRRGLLGRSRRRDVPRHRPDSEPETQAMDGLMARRLRVPDQLPLGGRAAALPVRLAGQTTYTADDPIFRALSGTDDDPAIEGLAPGAPDPYDPDVAAELYTTNGETTDHVYSRYGTLGVDAGDGRLRPRARRRRQRVHVPGLRGRPPGRVREEHPVRARRRPFGQGPGEPGLAPRPRGRADFEVAPSDLVLGDPQPVEATSSASSATSTINWRVNNGGPQSAAATEWDGGERYGDDGDVYYPRVRGKVTGAKPGDSVRVWFEAGGKRSQAFNYEVACDTDAPVLRAGGRGLLGQARQHPGLPEHRRAVTTQLLHGRADANGIAHDVYDVDARGPPAPDPLGVLSHYKAVIWYTGDDLVIREPGRRARRARRKLARGRDRRVRDYLNEGGKLLYTGKNAADGAARRVHLQPGRPAAVLPATPPDRRGRNANVRARCSTTTSCSTGWARTSTSRGERRGRRERR